MASAQSSNKSIVPRLMASVKRLAPAELRDFKRRFLDWQRESGEQTDGESKLLQVCQLQLPVKEQRRLRTLIGKSERGNLRPKELDEYRELVRHAEKIDAARLAALAQLARLWNKPVRLS